MLTVKNVTKKYGDFTALENINLEFGNGVYALLAPNGAGKTTLIKMLATLLFPTCGEILYDGTDIIRLDEKYRDVLGFLPQQFGFYKNYTPKQYLRYLGALKGLDKATTEKRIAKLLKLVGLEDDADKKMKKFSGGMLQRVGIAQAMLNNPKILILDEPTAGLDPKERVRFRNIISSLAQNRTVILSTHIVSDIETIATKVVMIKDHKLLCCSTVEEVCSTLKGKLYEQDSRIKLSKNDLFISERQDANCIQNRFVSLNPPEGAVPVTPNLEDVFLYIYREGV
ncbi:MAG: ABC transporter ATP-binding protein [Clostridia bacterium]|nr:ABC transporter ATP-binding protein [Clostridia bacterium]